MIWAEWVAVLRSLKGAGASVCLALLEAQGALTLDELVQATGYGRVSVTRAAALLELHGWATAVGDGWAMPAPGRAVFGLDSAEQDIAGNLFFSAAAAAAAECQSESNHCASSAAAANADSSSAVRSVLTGVGIGRNSPAMRRIVALGYSVGHVTAHVEAWRRDVAAGRARGVGLLIQRLLDGDAPPTAAACTCGRCDECRHRELTKYADVIAR